MRFLRSSQVKQGIRPAEAPLMHIDLYRRAAVGDRKIVMTFRGFDRTSQLERIGVGCGESSVKYR